MDYGDFISRYRSVPRLDLWAHRLPKQIEAGLSHQRYGDLGLWIEHLKSLPEIDCNSISLNSSRVTATTGGFLSELEIKKMGEALYGLHPWRKGPFEICGIHIDSEWRSDFKWDRLSSEIQPLDDRRVLDLSLIHISEPTRPY